MLAYQSTIIIINNMLADETVAQEHPHLLSCLYTNNQSLLDDTANHLNFVSFNLTSFPVQPSGLIDANITVRHDHDTLSMITGV